MKSVKRNIAKPDYGNSGETCIDLSYHQINGGGDTCPGYDVLVFTKGFNGIKADAEENLSKLSMKT